MRNVVRLAVSALCVFTTLVTNSAFAQICPQSVVTGEGIGDGCTLSYGKFDLGLTPEALVFNGTFTESCQRHDKCYTTLGDGAVSCNEQFLSDMRNTCRSRFHPLFRPFEYKACTQAASSYKHAVDLYASVANPIPTLHTNALWVSRQLKWSVDVGDCVTTPERTTLYTRSLIDEVNNTFLAHAGRPPTVFEFFEVMHPTELGWFPGYYLSSPETWRSNLISYAQSRKPIIPPSVYWAIEGEYLTVTNPEPGAYYEWHISNLPRVYGPTMYVGGGGMYNIERRLQGYVKVWKAGVANFSLVDTTILIPGWCRSDPGGPCL